MYFGNHTPKLINSSFDQNESDREYFPAQATDEELLIGRGTFFLSASTDARNSALWTKAGPPIPLRRSRNYIGPIRDAVYIRRDGGRTRRNTHAN